MTILAIDPGSERSGIVEYDPGEERVVETGHLPNEDVRERLRRGFPGPVVIEWTAPRGMLGSAQLFETLYWVGRFAEACECNDASGPAVRLERMAAKMYLVGARNAKDPQIRAALIDRFGGAGGKAAAVGTKKAQGPLYGVATHAWAALAIAVTWADQEGSLVRESQGDVR